MDKSNLIFHNQALQVRKGKPSWVTADYPAGFSVPDQKNVGCKLHNLNSCITGLCYCGISWAYVKSESKTIS